jgi:hypothetical protein
MDEFFRRDAATFVSLYRFVQPGVFPVDPATENIGVRAASASRVSKMAPVRGLFNQRVQKLDDFHFTVAQYGLAIAEEQHIKVVVEQFA